MIQVICELFEHCAGNFFQNRGFVYPLGNGGGDSVVEVNKFSSPVVGFQVLVPELS